VRYAKSKCTTRPPGDGGRQSEGGTSPNDDGWSGGGGVAWQEPWRQWRANSGAVASTAPTRQGDAETQPLIRPQPCARAPHRAGCSAAGRDNTGNDSDAAGASNGISAPRGILPTMMPPSVDSPPLTRHEGDRVCVGGCNTNSCAATPHLRSAENRAKAAGWLADTNRTCSWPDDTREASVRVGLSSRRANHRPRPSLLLLMVCPRSTDRRSWSASPPPRHPPRRHDLGPRSARLAWPKPSHTTPLPPHPRAPPPLSRERARGTRRDERTPRAIGHGATKLTPRTAWMRYTVQLRFARPSCPVRHGRATVEPRAGHGRGRRHTAHPPARGASVGCGPLGAGLGKT